MNTVELVKLCVISSMVGVLWWSCLIALLRSLGSRHTWSFPFGFHAKAREETQLVGSFTFQIIPRHSRQSSSAQTCDLIWMGHFCRAWVAGFASGFTVKWYFPGSFPIPSKWSGNPFLRSAVLCIGSSFSGFWWTRFLAIWCLSGAMLWVCNGFLKHVAQFIMMTPSLLDAGRPRMAGPSVSATYHQVHRMQGLLSWGFHLVWVSSALCWGILVSLQTDRWTLVCQSPVGVPSQVDPFWVHLAEEVQQNYITTSSGCPLWPVCQLLGISFHLVQGVWSLWMLLWSVCWFPPMVISVWVMAMVAALTWIPHRTTSSLGLWSSPTSMALVSPPWPGWQQLLPCGNLDFPCCDPVKGALFGWGGLPPWHLGPWCPNLVTFGASWISCGAVCSAIWMMSCAIGAVPGGYRWCVTITILTGMVTSVLVMVDCIHRFGAVEDLFSSLLDGKMVHSDVS